MRSLSRDALYDLVWSSPMSRLAHDLGVSDVAIAKACSRMNVPRPGVGYWAKHAAGKTGPQPPLPADDDSPAEWILPPTRPSKRKVPPTDVPAVDVPASLREPHKLIAKTERGLRRAEAAESGLLSPKGQGRLSVEVAPESVDRALRILDALLKALEKRGHRARSADGYQPETGIQVEGETVRIALRERLDRTEHKLTSEEKKEKARYGYAFAPAYDYEPTGELRFRLLGIERRGVRQSWADGKRMRLEDKLGEVVVGVEQAAIELRQAREESERWRREWEERRMREQEAEIRRGQERRRVDRLREMAREWEESESILRFANHIEAAAGGSAGSEKDVSRWLRWARAKAARLDPTERLLDRGITDLADEWKMGTVGASPK